MLGWPKPAVRVYHAPMGKKLLAHEYYKAPPFDVVLDPGRIRGRWHEKFGRQAPLHVEIGMGLGLHLVEYARRHPEMNHVGLEMKMHRIYTARQKALRQGVKHIRFIPGDAIRSIEAFADDEVDRLTLLFSDPWPRDQDAHKRLTAPSYIALYQRVLRPGGVLHFRTDDPGLFMFSKDTLEAAGFQLQIEVEIDRIKTDFEKRWLEAGRQIYGVDAVAPG